MPVPQVVRHQVKRLGADAGAIQRGAQQGVAVIGREHRLEFDRHFAVTLLGVDQHPLPLPNARMAEPQQRMVQQILGLLGRAGTAQILWRGAQQALGDNHRARHDVGVIESAGAQNRQIEIFNRGNQRRIHRDVQHHLGITAPELGHQRCQDVHCHHRLRVDAQQPCQLIGLLAGGGLGLNHIVEDLPGSEQIGLPGLGQRYLARCALNQPRTQMLLQVSHQACHRRGRHVHRPCSRRKATFVDDLQKHTH